MENVLSSYYDDNEIFSFFLRICILKKLLSDLKITSHVTFSIWAHLPDSTSLNGLQIWI